MKASDSRQRIFASVFIIGSGFLLYRTIALVAGGSLVINTVWVSALLFLEMLIDAACLFSSINWWMKNDKRRARLPLQLCAAMVIIHAVRVLIFVTGRVGPWINFDVRPEARAMHDTRWTWEGVYLAAILSALSIMVLIILWIYRKHIARII